MFSFPVAIPGADTVIDLIQDLATLASVDTQTMAILCAVGSAGATAVGATWAAMRSAYKGELKTLRERVDDCETDREGLHKSLETQGRQIAALSQQVGRLEGRLERHTKGTDHP